MWHRSEACLKEYQVHSDIKISSNEVDVWIASMRERRSSETSSSQTTATLGLLLSRQTLNIIDTQSFFLHPSQRRKWRGCLIHSVSIAALWCAWKLPRFSHLFCRYCPVVHKCSWVVPRFSNIHCLQRELRSFWAYLVRCRSRWRNWWFALERICDQVLVNQVILIRCFFLHFFLEEWVVALCWWFLAWVDYWTVLEIFGLRLMVCRIP